MQQTHAPATMHQGHPPRQEVHAPMSRQPQQPQSSYANADKFFRPEDTADDRLATLATGAPHGTKEREDKRYPRSPTRSGGAARPDHQSSGDGGQSASSGRDNTDATPGFDELTARFAAL